MVKRALCSGLYYIFVSFMQLKTTIALIVAAGKGERLGGQFPKQYLAVGGIPILRRTVEAFICHSEISHVVVVINQNDLSLYREAMRGLSLEEPVAGGKTRQESVYNGLKAIEKYNPDYVLIHDAARPLVSHNLINLVTENLKICSAVIPALSISDTVKELENAIVARTIDRTNLVVVQTPQGFHYKEILAAHEKAGDRSFSDDAGLAENAGIKVMTVAGEVSNFKITTQKDLLRAAQMLQQSETRIGAGFDVHKFGNDNSKIRLCGVDIPHNRSLEGHSDADVGLHALVDALLGAIGEGDIGVHFPDTSTKWKGADSAIFVEYACKLLVKHNAQIINADITIICESPKITPYRDIMRNRLAELLQISASRVNIKATTTEKLGFTGRGEGIAAQAIVSIRVLAK